MAITHLSRCQQIASELMKDIELISGIDCNNNFSAMNRVGILEGRRMIINAQIDEMVRIVKEKNEVAPPKPPEE